MNFKPLYGLVLSIFCVAHTGEDAQKPGIFSWITNWDQICKCLLVAHTVMMS